MKDSGSVILTIDGPSGSGKGTVSQAIAKRLGWHYLDSGALYRVLGYLATTHGIEIDNEVKLSTLVSHLDIQFDGDVVRQAGQDISRDIRTEEAGEKASKLAAYASIRAQLLDWQRQFAQAPGLVADGRDMGTVVFPNADCKIFLTASAEERAQRRYNQLRQKGFDVNIADLVAQIQERDARDRSRKTSPLVPADDALVVDSSKLSIDAVISTIVMALVDRELIPEQ